MTKRNGRRRNSDADPHQRGLNANADATEIRYDREADAYELRLRIGTRLSVPRKLLAYLPADAPPEALSDVQLEPMGTSVWWETLDTGYHLNTLIEVAMGGAYRLIGTSG
jgi:uncharacterized protein DUF2442